MAAHPGAYVCAVRQVPELDLTSRAGCAAVYDIVLRGSRDLFAAVPVIPAARAGGDLVEVADPAGW